MSNTKISSEQIIDGVALGGNPTTTTQSAGNNTTRVATTAFVTTAVANIVDSAPSALNTLNELAAAMNDNASFFSTVLPLSGGTMTGDLILGDSVKLEIGSASGGDLQIYHDGSNSFIDDAGTGILRVRGSEIQLQKVATTEIMIKAVADGQVELYYDNVLKVLTSSTGINLPIDGDSIKFGANSEVLLTHVHDVGLALDGALIIADNETDDTNKEGHFLARQYDSGTETEGFQILQYFANSSGNRIDVGGASSQYNASTEINFYTAANTTTRTGTKRLSIDSSGNIGFNATATFAAGNGMHFADAFKAGFGTGNGTRPDFQISGDNNGLAFACGTGSDDADVIFTTDGNVHLVGGNDRRIKLSDSGVSGASTSNNTVHIRGDNDNMKLNAAGNGGFIFEENGNERMRIASSGLSDIFSTTSTLRLRTGTSGTSGQVLSGFEGASTNANGTQRFVIFANGNIQNANNSYGQLSDRTLKENIVDATGKLDDLKKVKVRNFNFIGDDLKQIGVVAQELETVFPALVETIKDIDANGKQLDTESKSVKYSVFVPMLIKAMQEQQVIIDDLKARIETLEG
jgi:hypothetical protein